MVKFIQIQSLKHSEFINITDNIQRFLDDEDICEGLCYLYVPHTTAAVTINEGADPSVKDDIVNSLENLIPHVDNYQHLEGNSDAHIKATLVGSSEMIIIENGRLLLGTWQSIYFCEFDGPRERKIAIKLVKG